MDESMIKPGGECDRKPGKQKIPAKLAGIF